VEQVESSTGIRPARGRHGMQLVGGDTCASRSGLIISVTVLGRRSGRRSSRGPARAGDLVFVTGCLGDSGAGLELLNSRGRGRGPGSREMRKS